MENIDIGFLWYDAYRKRREKRRKILRSITRMCENLLITGLIFAGIWYSFSSFIPHS